MTATVRLVAVDRGIAARMRKVAADRGPSRSPGKRRIAVWQASSKTWSAPFAERESNILGPAPLDWPQTRSAQRHLGSVPG